MKHAAAARVMTNECLCFRARRASRAVTGIYDDALRPLGLQATQLTLLNAIALHGEHGAAMRDVAEFLVMDATTLSRNVRPLENAGLVQIERKPADGRVRMAVVTPAGERMIEQALLLWRRAHRRILAALGPDAVAELREQFDTAALAISEATKPLHLKIALANL